MEIIHNFLTSLESSDFWVGVFITFLIALIGKSIESSFKKIGAFSNFKWNDEETVQKAKIDTMLQDRDEYYIYILEEIRLLLTASILFFMFSLITILLILIDDIHMFFFIFLNIFLIILLWCFLTYTIKAINIRLTLKLYHEQMDKNKKTKAT